ncbi:MAG: DUF3034 family protein [Hahellaceae bacterium]|nr:DUF3034 family protein [Hahellaceae bacterium]
MQQPPLSRCLPQARVPLLLSLLLTAALPAQAGGKLLATPGLNTIDGTAGGGLVPWATLSGYATRDELAATVFLSQTGVGAYRLQVAGAALNFYDRVEVSFANQTFLLKGTGSEIGQQVFGLKTRLYGDLVYSFFPQISAGIQFRELQDGEIAGAVGADNARHGTDYFVTASKLQLGALFGYNLLWNVGLRASDANQTGFLGFGGDAKNAYSILGEGSVAVLLTRSLAVGVEYRQKPDNLSFAREDDWQDVFIAYLPNKHLGVAIAWADLGHIAGQDNQQGLYLSINGALW